jgi:hypothetical protein
VIGPLPSASPQAPASAPPPRPPASAEPTRQQLDEVTEAFGLEQLVWRRAFSGQASNPANHLSTRHYESYRWIVVDGPRNAGETMFATVSDKSIGEVRGTQMGYDGAYVLTKPPAERRLTATEEALGKAVGSQGPTCAIRHFPVGGVGSYTWPWGRAAGFVQRRLFAHTADLRVPDGCTAFAAGPGGELALCYQKKVWVVDARGEVQKTLQAPSR